MQAWRLLTPKALGFTLKNLWHSILDKATGAPSRPERAAAYVLQHAKQGDPQKVLDTLDRFALEVRWLMSVGPEKGPLVQEMATRVPANARILELGAYCGYSAILLAQKFGTESKITSIEISATNAKSAKAIVEHAGLGEQIEFLVGPSTQMIETLSEPFHLVFLDHWKDLYKQDLQLIEARQLIQAGSIVVADNVGKVFSPEEFLTYVRDSGRYSCEHREAAIEYTSVPDAVEICVYEGVPEV